MTIDLGAWMHILGSPMLVFFSDLCALILVPILLVALKKCKLGSEQGRRSAQLLSFALTSFIVLIGINVVIASVRLGICSLPHFNIVTLKRFHWTTNVLYHLFLSLFLESLISNQIKIARWYTIIRTSAAITLSCLFILSLPWAASPTSCGPILRAASYIFNIIIGVTTIGTVLHGIKRSTIPRLLHHQITLFIRAFFIPHLALKLVTFSPLTDGRPFDTFFFNFVAISYMLGVMCYCTFRLMGLRFLNAREQVTASRRFNFVSLMKDVLAQLNSVANSAEFRHVTQRVFSQAFDLPSGSVRLIIFGDANYLVSDEQLTLLRESLAAKRPLAKLLSHTKVITRDEIDFSAYYSVEPAYHEAADFLRKFSADAFIPVYDRNAPIGCIIVSEGARPKKFYSSNEQNEMALFAGSLSSIITLVKNRNMDVVLAQKHALTADVYSLNREVGQYRESIRSFVRQAHDRRVGVLYYKINNFTLANQAAHELIDCDLNQQRGHPLTIQLRKIAQNAEKYAAPQSTTIMIGSEQRLAVSAFPSLERQATLMVVTQPGIGELVEMRNDLLRDPNQWNYLLHLETTETGRLIHELIPGTSKTLLNFKVELLRAALSHRAVLLSACAEDRQACIGLLHRTGRRQQLSTITLKDPEKNLSIARELFGISEILGAQQHERPLLERLDKIGTLCIENVHLLSRESQAHLAEFLRYGAFSAIHDDQRVPADVRIICTSSESLVDLVEAGSFLPELLDELSHHKINVPEPAMLERKEFDELITQYLEQMLKDYTLQKMFSLSNREGNLLYKEKCPSFIELRRRLNALITAKASAKEVCLVEPGAGKATQLTVKGARAAAIHDIVDQELIASDERISRAILLGKKALRDPELMRYLWEKFQNQAKIATLLGVNRSSVNRRFKSLGL